MTRVLLIRHGDTDFVGRGFAGWLPDVHLSQAGHAQAERLAEMLAAYRIDVLYSSPLERALQTAAPIARRFGLSVQPCAAIGELQLGDWTGRSFESLSTDARFVRFNTFRSVTRIPGGEALIEVQSRVLEALLSWRAEHGASCVAAVSHCDVIRGLLSYILGMPVDMSLRLQIDPASVSVIEFDDDSVRVECMNVRAPSS